MTRWFLVLALCIPTSVHAERVDDPIYACKPAPPNMKLSVSFQPEVSIKDLVTWVMGFTCKNVIIDANVAKHATKVTLIAPNKYTPKQAFQLFVDAIESTGLVVVQKADTIIIKAGPTMPKSCPDIAVAPTAPVAPAPAVATRSQDDIELEAELAAGIKQIDPTHYQLSRAMIDKVLLNPMAVAKGARVIPAIKDGKPNGFKLYAIRPTSIYAKLGFSNGDTITAINKYALVAADKALEIYTKLREAKQLEVELVRRGKPVTLVFTIK